MTPEDVKATALLLAAGETEDNWERFEVAVVALAAAARSEMLSATALRQLRAGIVACVLSERTRLSRSALLLVDELAVFTNLIQVAIE